MSLRFKARCERVRSNNGMVEVLFVRSAEMADTKSQEEVYSMNLHVPADRYEVGREYWVVHPEPAFPH